MFDPDGNPLLVRMTELPVPDTIPPIQTEALKHISRVHFDFLSEVRTAPHQDNSTHTTDDD